MILFFFFKQKTAYEMRISDWSSDVCSSDLVKLFVTASPEMRALRRMRELQQRELPADFDALVADIRARDERDMNRPIAPLKQAIGAALLDTSDLSIEAAVRTAIALVDAQVEGKKTD